MNTEYRASVPSVSRLLCSSRRWLVLAGLLLLSPFATGQPAQEDRNVLIVYLTRTSNTERVAKMIHEKAGGKLVSLELEQPYPEDYEAIVEQVDQENETGYLPPLKTKVERIEDYDTIFLGFPTWDMQLPPPMKSFLNEYDLSGKTVIPFNTHGGYGVGRGLEMVNELCPNADILDGFSVRGGLEKEGVLLAIKGERADKVDEEVELWLERIGIR